MQALKIAGFMPMLIKSQFLITIPEQTADFSNQTVIVTGSNTGLGKEAARQILQLGASKVILGVRTISKGDAAAKDILPSRKHASSTVEVWQLDMSSKTSIATFATRAQDLDRLDAVVLNAGIMTRNWSSTEDGYESTIGINVVGNMLIATQLLPTMQQSAENTGLRGRLTFVGSDMMYIANLSELETSGSILEKLNNEVISRSWISSRYQLSKILLFWAAKDLAARNPLAEHQRGVLITVQTPGACKSDLFRDTNEANTKSALSVMKGTLERSTEVGARTMVHAVGPDLEAEAHGKFLMDAKIGADGLNVTSAQAQRLAAKWNEEMRGLLRREGVLKK